MTPPLRDAGQRFVWLLHECGLDVLVLSITAHDPLLPSPICADCGAAITRAPCARSSDRSVPVILDGGSSEKPGVRHAIRQFGKSSPTSSSNITCVRICGRRPGRRMNISLPAILCRKPATSAPRTCAGRHCGAARRRRAGAHQCGPPWARRQLRASVVVTVSALYSEADRYNLLHINPALALARPRGPPS
jgi:hypothetical protein